MGIFANRRIWKKLVIVLLLITIFAFVVPQSVQASDDDETSIGGTLMKPICNLLVGLCDGVLNLLHRFVVDSDDTLIRISLSSGWLRKTFYYNSCFSCCVFFGDINFWGGYSCSNCRNCGCCSDRHNIRSDDCIGR